VHNLAIKPYHNYVFYTNIMLYHIIRRVQYYQRFHITVVGHGTYYLWIRGSACIT